MQPKFDLGDLSLQLINNKLFLIFFLKARLHLQTSEGLNLYLRVIEYMRTQSVIKSFKFNNKFIIS